MQYKFAVHVAAFAFAFALLIPQCSSHAQETTRRVLVLLSYNLTYPGVLSVGEGAIERLRDKSPELELLSEFLDLARFPGPEHESRTERYLAENMPAGDPMS